MKEKTPYVDLWRDGRLVRLVQVPKDLCKEEFHLCDFGMAKNVNEVSTEPGFPPMLYCSPELRGEARKFVLDKVR